MLPGVVEANGSSVALIALTTDNAIDYEAQGALTVLEQIRLFESVTKWTAQIKHADMLPRFVRRSFRNWFRPHYPYVFSKFRCVTDA